MLGKIGSWECGVTGEREESVCWGRRGSPLIQRVSPRWLSEKRREEIR